MTYQPNCTLPEELLEQIAAEGLDALPELIRILINEAMRLERQQYLGAGPYERSPERTGHTNGYKPKTVKPVWVRTSSSSRRCEKATSIQMRWRRGCAAKEPRRWRWLRCMSRVSPLAGWRRISGRSSTPRIGSKRSGA